jgi:hypothetical protein
MKASSRRKSLPTFSLAIVGQVVAVAFSKS